MAANVHAYFAILMTNHQPRYQTPSNPMWPQLRRAFCFPATLCGVLALTIFAVARDGLNDPDIWWHLRNAELLFHERRWLRADTYSYTVFGHPWVNHEWLAEIPYYAAWRLFDLAGIKVLSLLLLAAIFSGVLCLCWWKSGNIKAAAAACFLAVLLGSVSFGPRTILFGYAYLVILLVLLERFHARGKAPLWVLPPLFGLWANTHGSWSIGMAVLLVFIGCGLVEGHWHNVVAKRWSRSQLRKLAGAAALSVAALFVNPYVYRLVLYPLDIVFRQRLNVAHVQEWSSVDFHDIRGKIALLTVLLLLAGAIFGRYQWKLHEVVLVAFGIYAGFTHVRFLFLAGIFLAPVIANLMSWMPAYRPEIDKPLLNALILAGALAFIVHAFPTSEKLRESTEREYPAEILPHLKSNPPSGLVLNFYTWGGYLVWRNPDFRDFIDSRVDVFEYAGVLRDYLDLINLKSVPAVLEKYHARYVLFPPEEPLSHVLEHDPGWKVIYAGRVSIMFERVDREPGSTSPGARIAQQTCADGGPVHELIRRIGPEARE